MDYQPSASLPLHPGLEDQNGGHLVDDLAPAQNRHVGLAEQAVGFGRSKSFVPQVYWQADLRAEFIGEAMHFLGLDSFSAAHAQREPDHDLGHIVISNHLREFFEVQPFVLPLEGFESLRGDAQRI